MNHNKLHAFHRKPTLENSMAYMGSVMSFLAEGKDTAGRFALVENRSKPGNEPPPHVHEREHEFFYIVQGSMQFFCEEKVIVAQAGEVVFIPQGMPHTFRTLSTTMRVLVLLVEATGTGSVGLDRYFRAMSEPAVSMDLPTDTVTYATATKADMERAERIANEVGLRLLTPEETATVLPQYRDRGVAAEGERSGGDS
jgi:mannose-6-phosphate isomerase-like protein (cupin superfamily)